VSDKICWVTDTPSLEAEVERMGGTPLAIDTEADSLHHYPEKVCLIQASFGGRDLLIDPLSEIDIAPLARPLADPALCKILHGSDYDVRVLNRDFGIALRGIFDTMIAARLIGARAFGLAALLDKHLGVQLDKRFQRADWSLRPMPRDMQAYAILDTCHLETLMNLLAARLAELGRTEWAEEEFRRLENVRWTGNPDDNDAFLRMKNIGSLGPRELAVLREVYTLREREARERDRPPFKILGNETLIELACRRPQDMETLAQVPRLERRFTGGRAAQTLLDAVRRGLDLPEDACPRAHPVREERPDKEYEARLREVCQRRDAAAQMLDLEPSVLAPRALLDAMLRRTEAGESPADTPDLRRWQAGLLLPIFG